MLTRRDFGLGAVTAAATAGLAMAPALAATNTRLFPEWRPSFRPDTKRVIDTMRYYTDEMRDFVVFENSTCCLVDDGLSDAEAGQVALETLRVIMGFHVDLNSLWMDDYNLLIRYNAPAYNVVFPDQARQHWKEVEAKHLDGLVNSEVLISPLGQNVFNDEGKMALLGRCWMFMDARAENIATIVRATA